ncbi:MAG: hypothetical protein KDJ64_01390 [Nitratireductor sp.]|nr:hypothetical protein [Nitratireductor sp.]
MASDYLQADHYIEQIDNVSAPLKTGEKWRLGLSGTGLVVTVAGAFIALPAVAAGVLLFAVSETAVLLDNAHLAEAMEKIERIRHYKQRIRAELNKRAE